MQRRRCTLARRAWQHAAWQRQPVLPVHPPKVSRCSPVPGAISRISAAVACHGCAARAGDGRPFTPWKGVVWAACGASRKTDRHCLAGRRVGQAGRRSTPPAPAARDCGRQRGCRPSPAACCAGLHAVRGSAVERSEHAMRRATQVDGIASRPHPTGPYAPRTPSHASLPALTVGGAQPKQHILHASRVKTHIGHSAQRRQRLRCGARALP